MKEPDAVDVRTSIHGALSESLARVGAPAGTAVILERPREASHGDMSSPIAMSLAKDMRKNPLRIAEDIVSGLQISSDVVSSVDVLKPGFINFRFADSVVQDVLPRIAEAGERYGASGCGRGAKVLVEYVSANPTGPLVIVSARAAAVGSVLVNLLNFSGFDAEGEYYVNDYGKQVDALGESLRYRLRERLGLLAKDEELGAYPGEYLKELAASVDPVTAKAWLREGAVPQEPGRFAAARLTDTIRDDLAAYGVHFAHFFLESSLHPEATAGTLQGFLDAGVTYESEGALFFRSTEYGDDKDRVLRKSNGENTYFLADVAYHRNKLARGCETAIGLLGPDHHGHVARMKAAMTVFGAADDWLEVMIVGWVRLLENGNPVSMSKRAGEFITMRDLVADVGVDVAKYFFLMRRGNSPLDFDLTLARKQSDENPVYYVQYAHARIASVIRFAREKGAGGEGAADLSLLTTAEERSLMLHLLYFPYVVEGAALAREPHRLTAYAQELATAFHQFYHVCRIVTDDDALSRARLELADGTRTVLRNALGLLGVSAPSSM